MPRKIGQSTTYGTIVPNFSLVWRIARNNKLSSIAKHRLRVLDYYYVKANCNVSLTARHFGCTRSYIYKWLKRFNPKCLLSLESRSCKPKHCRTAQYNARHIEIIKKIRHEYPTYSSFKVEVILRRDYDIKLSHATIGRIIKRYQMFYGRKVDLHHKLSKTNTNACKRRKVVNRLKYYLQTCEVGRIIEFDMKHITNGDGAKQYAFCGIDPVSKQGVIHVASKPSSGQAKVAIEEVIRRFGKDIFIVCDNGSENFKEVYDLLQELQIPQLFARPHTPKDKPHIENFIGKYQKECLDETLGDHVTLADRRKQAKKWLNDWHYYRPHQALAYYTPAEFCDMMGITITY